MNQYENKNLFKLKLEQNIPQKYYYHKHKISKQLWSQYMVKGVSINTIIRYDLFYLIDMEQLPDWYEKIREMESGE